jgi:hypothetical protein
MHDAPAASRAKKKKRTRTYKVHRKQTAFPAQWFYGCSVLSLVYRAF